MCNCLNGIKPGTATNQLYITINLPVAWLLNGWGMGKKVLWIFLVPLLLVIAGYLALQVYLRTGKDAAEQSVTGTENRAAADTGRDKPDSLGGKKVSPLDLRPLFIQKLQGVISKSTRGLYSLSVGDLKMDVLASQVSLKEVALRPNETVVAQLRAAGELPANIFTVSFEGLTIDGITLADALPTYDPPGTTSDEVYDHIATHLAHWVEHAIASSQDRLRLTG